MSSEWDKVYEQLTGPPNPQTRREILSDLGLAEPASKEDIYKAIEYKLLTPKTRLPTHWLSTYQIQWDHELEISSLLTTEVSEPPTTLSFVRTGLDGRVTGYKEVPAERRRTGLSSTSLDRAPGPSQNFVRGKSGHVPFWPGGLDEVLKPSEDGQVPLLSSKLRTVPPGFARGLRFGDGEEDEAFIPSNNADGALLDDTMENGGVSGNIVEDSAVPGPRGEIDDLLPTSRANLQPVAVRTKAIDQTIQKREWAHVVDVMKPMRNFHELVPNMAREYPFELDTFQKEAVYHLEMGDSVFVAAHTSAGKTVVAEYAIALAQKHMTRAIYTSPIKALSNQKFRDFKETFSSTSVGILTGDVQINPEANCLVMTTEILRSMLYKGADLIRDVEFVIFDEVHYVNDAERGVVWEEVIIMLPEHVSIILLSATVPNTREFADWVGRTKKKDIYVISTLFRPVPLEHYLYAGRDTYKLVDSKRNFLPQGYKDAHQALRRKQDKEREAAGLPPVQRLGRAAAPQRGGRGGPPQRGGGRGGGQAPGRGGRAGGGGGSFGSKRGWQQDKSLYVHLVGYLKKNSLLPVVIFTFSKKRCEENAGTLTNIDLCTAKDKSEVHVTIEKALSRLKGSDKKLPQIQRMRDILSRGIGVHHGGLLPIVKEVVEILFARGLVKVLFATETFAMGVNMPARCVVFNHIRKHDGTSFRDILPGEYTQMAGRAGRRGLDTTGTVIINCGDNVPEEHALRQMILGTPAKLTSQFRLTYNMILNLLRVEALKVEEMIKRSFSENASQKLMPEHQKQVIESEKKLATLVRLNCNVCAPDIEKFYDSTVELVKLNRQIMETATMNPHRVKSLVPGRVIVIQDQDYTCNVAVIVKPAVPTIRQVGGREEKIRAYMCLILVNKETSEQLRNADKRTNLDAQPLPPRWPPQPEWCFIPSGEAKYHLAPIPYTSIALCTDRMIQVACDEIMRTWIRPMKEGIALLGDVVNDWVNAPGPEPKHIPEIDWSRLRLLDFQQTLKDRDELVKQRSQCACTLCENFEEHYTILHGEKLLRANIANLKLAISDQNLELIPDYEQRVEVLKELKFIDANSTVLLKGRVACEINSADELILTELILENTLASYDPEEVVALLSCFLFQEKADSEPAVSPKLAEGRDTIFAIGERVEAVQNKHGVPTPDVRERLKFGLMEVVYEWAKGMPFEQITNLTDVAEGTIVRVITRLDETCREVRDAARVIGDADLMKKMEDAQLKIERDIVFAASLYF